MREMLLASKLERCGLLKCGEFPTHRKDAQIYQVVKKHDKYLFSCCSNISRLKNSLNF